MPQEYAVDQAASALVAELRRDAQQLEAIDFCALWPTAKQVLEFIAGRTSNAFVKLAITIIESAGDNLCPAASGNRASQPR